MTTKDRNEIWSDEKNEDLDEGYRRKIEDAISLRLTTRLTRFIIAPTRSVARL